MALHADVPGMGSFGVNEGGGMFALQETIDRANELDDAFDAKQVSSELSEIVGEEPSIPMLSTPAAPAPAPFLDASPIDVAIAGGRPPAATPGLATGSASTGAGKLLLVLATAAAAGAYFRSARAAGAGFLLAGGAMNLYNSQAASAQPDPASPNEGAWTAGAGLLGLGLGAYLAYGVYEGKR